MQKIALLLVITLLSMNSCEDESEQQTKAGKQLGLQIQQNNFNCSCQLLSIKYSVSEDIVKQILLAYNEDFECWGYLVLTQDGGSEKEKEQCKERYKKSERYEKTMKELIKELAVKNDIQESLIANIIFDYKYVMKE